MPTLDLTDEELDVLRGYSQGLVAAQAEHARKLERIREEHPDIVAGAERLIEVKRSLVRKIEAAGR